MASNLSRSAGVRVAGIVRVAVADIADGGVAVQVRAEPPAELRVGGADARREEHVTAPIERRGCRLGADQQDRPIAICVTLVRAVAQQGRVAVVRVDSIWQRECLERHTGDVAVEPVLPARNLPPDLLVRRGREVGMVERVVAEFVAVRDQPGQLRLAEPALVVLVVVVAERQRGRDVEDPRAAEVGVAGDHLLQDAHGAVGVDGGRTVGLHQIAELRLGAIVERQDHRGLPRRDVQVAGDELVHRGEIVTVRIKIRQVAPEGGGGAIPHAGRIGQEGVVHQDRDRP